MLTALEWLRPSDVKGGLWRLLVASLLIMTALRALFNPEIVVFRVGEAGAGDYWTMVVLGSFLIAIDAMLLVLLSWNHLRDWKDAVGVASLVGATHVFFPLFTFAVTAGTAIASDALGLPVVLAGGAQTAIYFVAFAFVTDHLWEVHKKAREGEADVVEPAAPVMTWKGMVQVFPAVFAVSIDALMVGPGKIGFMARYTTADFLLSFVWIGTFVFVLVFASGLIVLALKAFVEHREAISRRVHQFDWWGVLGLIAVFIYFSVFGSVYFLYTFSESDWLLRTETIVTVWIACCLLYLLFGKIGEIKAASRERAGLAK
ncbi:MAG: hypothetical protein UY63_C0003G0029 [Parcubacteria group bacterium GW2011_GWA2_51_10]|nr:MAG: hypothetical protein UY63_C0003G0029 [Parcubacteria group bacterium GW2011_GWA2_51_10]